MRERLEHDTRINLGMTADIAAERLQDILGGFETDLAARHRTIADETRRVAEFDARLGQRFPLTGELDLKRDQLAAIEADLAATTTAEAA